MRKSYSIKGKEHSAILDPISLKIIEDFSVASDFLKLLMEDRVSDRVLGQAKSLHQSINHLIEKLEKIREYKEDTSELQVLHEIPKEISETIQNVERLIEKFNSTVLNFYSAEDSVKEFENEILKITSVSPINSLSWSLKIKSSAKNRGSFRNVTVFEVENNRDICEIGLIEPGTELKITIPVLAHSNHLLAKINNKIVSFPFRIPKVKLIKTEFRNNKLKGVIQNFSFENVESADIISNGEAILKNIHLKPQETKVYPLGKPFDKKSEIIIIEKNTVIS